MLVKTCFVGACGGLLMAAVSHAATLTPTVDVGVQNNNTVANDRLLVKNQENGLNERVSFFRYDASGITDTVVSASIDLQIFAHGNPAEVDLQLFGIPDAGAGEDFGDDLAWGDYGITDIAQTDNNVDESLLGGAPLATVTMPSTAVTGDIVTFSSQELIDFINADANDILSFVLATSTIDNDVYLAFYTNENGAGNPATLHYELVPEPASLALLGLGGLALAGRRRHA